MRAMQFPTVTALTGRLILAALLGALLAVAATPPATAESVAGITEHDQPGLFPPEYREGFTRWIKSRGTEIKVMLYDASTGYAYVTCDGYPGVVTKLALGDDLTPPRIVGEVELAGWEGPIAAGALDAATGHAYFMTYTWSGNGGRFIKVRLGEGEEPPTRVGAVVQDATWAFRRFTGDRLAIDSERGCGYVATDTKLDKLALDVGDNGEPGFISSHPLGKRLVSLLLNPTTCYGFMVGPPMDAATKTFRVERFDLTGPNSPITTFMASEFSVGGSPIWAIIDKKTNLIYVATQIYYSAGPFAEGKLHSFVHVLNGGTGNEGVTHLSHQELPVGVGLSGDAFLDSEEGAIYVVKGDAVVRLRLNSEGTAPVYDTAIPLPSSDTLESHAGFFDVENHRLILAYQGKQYAGVQVAQARLDDDGATLTGMTQLPPRVGPLKFAVHLPSTGDLVLGSGSIPPQLLRVPEAHYEDFERPIPWELFAEWESAPRCAVLDDTTLQLLVGLGETNGQVAQVFVGVDDDPFVLGATIDLPADESKPNCAVFDPRSRVALFGADTTPGRIVVVAPGEDEGPPSRLGAIVLEEGEDRLVRAVLDESSGYAYFVTRAPNARVVKVAMGQAPGEMPSRVSAAAIEGTGAIQDLLLHAEAGYLYVVRSSPSRIIRLDLGEGDAAPEVLATVPLGSGSSTGANVLLPGLNTLFMNVAPLKLGIYSLGMDGTMPSEVATHMYSASTGMPNRNFDLAGAVPGTDRVRFMGGDFAPFVVELEAKDVRFAHLSRIELAEDATLRSVRVYSHRAMGNMRLAIYDDARAPVGVVAGGALAQMKAAALSYSWPRQRMWESPPVANTAEEDWLEVPVPAQDGRPLGLPPGTYWLGWQVDTQVLPVSRVAPASSSPRSVRIPWDWGEFPDNAVDGFDGDAYTDQVNAWSAHLVYDPLPEVTSITPLPRSGPAATTAAFEVRFNTPVQGAESAEDYWVAHSGTAHATVSVEGEGDLRVLTVGGLTGRGSFTVAVRLDRAVRSMDDVPLHASLVSEPTYYLEDYWDGGAAGRHALDTNADGRISLSELLRLIQFYNSGGLHCADPAGTFDDSFEPGENFNARNCPPHSSDYGPQDWRISLSELLRAVQIYNSGAYHPCPDAVPATEDGFCPGPAPV